MVERKPGEEPRVEQRPTSVRPQEAMLNYLDALLQDVTELAEPEVAVAAPAVEPVAEVAVATVAAEVPVLTAPAEVVAQAPAVADTVESDIDFPLPEWADQRFECLLFDVAGLTMAIPLIELGGIQKLARTQMNSLPSQPEWYLGLVPSEYGQLQVVDSAAWIMPERLAGLELAPYRYLVRLGDTPWALAVNRIIDSSTLDPQAVQWRLQRSRRKWLAGTIKEQMCALLDAGVMSRLMQQRCNASQG